MQLVLPLIVLSKNLLDSAIRCLYFCVPSLIPKSSPLSHDGVEIVVLGIFSVEVIVPSEVKFGKWKMTLRKMNLQT